VNVLKSPLQNQWLQFIVSLFAYIIRIHYSRRTWLDKLSIYYYSHDWRYFFLAKAASEFDVIMKRLKLKGIITNAGKTAID
jgi:IS5 family transposase